MFAPSRGDQCVPAAPSCRAWGAELGCRWSKSTGHQAGLGLSEDQTGPGSAETPRSSFRPGSAAWVRGLPASWFPCSPLTAVQPSSRRRSGLCSCTQCPRAGTPSLCLLAFLRKMPAFIHIMPGYHPPPLSPLTPSIPSPQCPGASLLSQNPHTPTQACNSFRPPVPTPLCHRLGVIPRVLAMEGPPWGSPQ